MDDSQGHVHTAHIIVLTSVIRCLNKQLPKMEWKKNLYLTVIWSVWHYTDFWQQRQNRVFFSFFFFFFFLYLMCSFQLQLSVWSLLTHSLVLNRYWFQPRNKRSKGKTKIPSNQISPPKYNLPFLASNEKIQKHVKYFSFFYSRSVTEVAKISLS